MLCSLINSTGIIHFCLFQMVVAGMAAHTDINRAHEVANEVRRIHKQLKEAQTLASTYNNRERLFGMPVTNVRIFGNILNKMRTRN